MAEDIKIIPRVIVVPKREIVRHGNRWIIYLPQDYSELWETIKKSGKKVRIYIEVID